jgi:hypothetical protein
MSIGYVYLDLFEVLINPPCGGRILSVKQQLEGILKELEDKPLAEYFEGTVAKHVYYISDFLCRAGEKEKKRRTKNNDVGACIGAVSRHFVTKASEIEAVKRDLPYNLADLIDRRSCYGVLKYPNLQFYTLVARLEYCYSKLATSQSISKFGGIVVACICDEMVGIWYLWTSLTASFVIQSFLMQQLIKPFIFM